MIRQIKEIASFTVIFLLGSLAFVGPLKAESIRMAWFTVPPHAIVADDGVTPEGPSIELFNAIAARMGCTVDWIGPLPLSRLAKYQKEGGETIDGTILTAKSMLLVPFLYFPKEAYFVDFPCLAVRADNPLKSVTTIDDISGYRIGFVKLLELRYPPLIKNNQDKIIIEDLSGSDWTSRNLSKLLVNRIDAVFELNRYAIEYQAIVDNVENKIRILDIPAKPILHYYVFHKNSPKGERLLRRYERAVKGMNIDYDSMVKKEIAKFRKQNELQLIKPNSSPATVTPQ